VWLLDAVLQFQPYMFTRDFATQTLAPSAAGNPAWAADPVNWAADLVAGHPVLLNSVFATVQLLPALGLFWRRTGRVTLAASVVCRRKHRWCDGPDGVSMGDDRNVAQIGADGHDGTPATWDEGWAPPSSPLWAHFLTAARLTAQSSGLEEFGSPMQYSRLSAETWA
jgi:hypothetical protein